MSNWTHVLGIIRAVTFGTEVDFDEIIGYEWHRGDGFIPGMKWMPDGSEGSLCKTVDGGIISIFGDLRDHEDPQEIIDWFNGVCESLDKDCWVRQAVITVANEQNGTLDWRYEKR